MANELVLSLVQPYLQDPQDYANSQLVSKWLHKTGTENPLRPLAPLGWRLEAVRKPADRKRLLKHATKHAVQSVYLASELPEIHSQLIELGMYSIIGENVRAPSGEDSFTCEVEPGFYLPVMYKRQNRPIYSLILALDGKSPAYLKKYRRALAKLQIQAVFHPGIPLHTETYARHIVERHDPNREHPDYKWAMIIAKMPDPFSWRYTTFHKRFEEKAPAIFTIG
jgi:hypothetical protein